MQTIIQFGFIFILPKEVSRWSFSNLSWCGVEGFAKGGWISGPQSGYPVSLDGNKPDFIGHGTEYVARKGDEVFLLFSDV